MRRVVVGLLALGLLIVAAVVAVGVLLRAPTDSGAGDAAEPPGRSATDPGGPEPERPTEEELRAALSTPREDSYYPDVGDPGVDSLHHELDLTWTPGTERLEGTDRLTFRATRDAERFQLDLGEPLDVDSVAVDGERSSFRKEDDVLLVETPVVEDEWYVATIRYAGTPEPTPVPTERPDFSTTGWTTTPDGEVWTMQEPYGAFTWYPVNDHPSDEALYDVTISVPAPWVGISNGVLAHRAEHDGRTVTRWHADEPIASYLVTIAIGDYESTRAETDSGLEVTYWTPPGDPSAVADLRATIPAMAWVEQRLGPYPFSSLGMVLVPARSAMETQTMLTLGDNDYVRSPPVLLHELVHQWYGNQVTPSDWRDLWMNEGMTMYLQLLWQAEDQGREADAYLETYSADARRMVASAGPPGRYDPDFFGDSNVYYVPALMWHDLRQRLGDERFWEMVRAWPGARDNQNPTRQDYLAWIEEQTGEELTDFFRDWLTTNRPLRGGDRTEG